MIDQINCNILHYTYHTKYIEIHMAIEYEIRAFTCIKQGLVFSLTLDHNH